MNLPMTTNRKIPSNKQARVIALLWLAQTVDLKAVNQSKLARALGVDRSTVHREVRGLDETKKLAAEYLAAMIVELAPTGEGKST